MGAGASKNSGGATPRHVEQQPHKTLPLPEELAAGSFEEGLKKWFPGALPLDRFAIRTLEQTTEFGFTPENVIPLVSTCRDENCLPLLNQMHEVWGDAFAFTALSALPLPGKTAIKAYAAHVPSKLSDRRKFVIVIMPHIGLSDKGEIGKCTRPGLDEVSHSCGALAAFHHDLQHQPVNTKLDYDDLEYSLLKKILSKHVFEGTIPNFLDLTKIALETSYSQIVAQARSIIDTEKCDLVVYSGILINAPENAIWIWPNKCVAYVDGKTQDLQIGESREQQKAEEAAAQQPRD